MNEITTAETTEVAVQNETTTAVGNNVIDEMSRAYNLGKYMCQAQIIPENYRNKPADCMLAIDMANRMNVSPIFVMQNMYVVKGKPSWSGQACKALIDSCGKFRDVKHVYTGEAGTDTRGCYLEAVRVSDGEKVKGVEVTIAMARAEGWFSNKKWQTMTDLMLGYRAAAFFARINCPETLMGLQTADESEDIDKPNNARGLTDALRGTGNVQG